MNINRGGEDLFKTEPQKMFLMFQRLAKAIRQKVKQKEEEDGGGGGQVMEILDSRCVGMATIFFE